MLYAALFIFLLVAAVGVYMTILLMRGRRVPGRLAITHGIVGLATLGLLITAVFLVPHTMLVNDAALLFGGAAVFGIFMFLLGREGPVPWPLAWLHGLVAIIAIALLAVGLISV